MRGLAALSEERTLKQRGNDGQRGEDHTDKCGDHVIQPLRAHGIQQVPGGVASQESPEMRIVVNAWHHESKDKHDYGIGHGLAADMTAAAASAIDDERTEKAKYRSRGSQSEGGPAEEKKRHCTKRVTSPTAEQEAGDGRNCVNHDQPAAAVEFRNIRSELSHPHQIERDMQDVAVQPCRAEDSPPPAVAEHRHGAACAEEEESAEARRQDGHSAHLDAAWVDQECCDVESPASPHHDGYESQVIADTPQKWAKTPEAGISASAVPACFILHPYKLSTRGADYRSCSLSLKHSFIMLNSVTKEKLL